MGVFSQTVFTVWGYPLSVLELLGVLTGLLAVYLAWKEQSTNFLVGMLNNVCYFLLFFQFHLYSVMLLQVVYFAFSVYGYYHWKHPKHDHADEKKEQRILRLTGKQWLFYGGLIGLTSVLWGWSVIRLQAHFPEYFAPPTYPWLDAALTMSSVVGQWLLSKKIWDNWVIWLVVDVVSTVLFASLGMVFTAVMYGIFSLIALKALLDWMRTYKTYQLLTHER